MTARSKLALQLRNQPFSLSPLTKIRVFSQDRAFLQHKQAKRRRLQKNLFFSRLSPQVTLYLMQRPKKLQVLNSKSLNSHKIRKRRLFQVICRKKHPHCSACLLKFNLLINQPIYLALLLTRLWLLSLAALRQRQLELFSAEIQELVCLANPCLINLLEVLKQHQPKLEVFLELTLDLTSVLQHL